MPAYNENRWSALYFVSFMILSFFFFMNVILASVANAYDNAVGNRKQMHATMRSKNLKAAFQYMDPTGKGRIDRDTVMALFLILNVDFPEFRTLSEDDTKLLFAILDKVRFSCAIQNGCSCTVNSSLNLPFYLLDICRMEHQQSLLRNLWILEMCCCWNSQRLATMQHSSRLDSRSCLRLEHTKDFASLYNRRGSNHLLISFSYSMQL